jgi:hypothetical protein
MQLSDEQVQAVKQQGFLCVPRITSDEEALAIKASLERLFQKKVGWNEGAYGELSTGSDVDEEPNSPQILLPVNYAPDLHKTECFAHALRFAKQILGERAAFVLDLAILKRARQLPGTRITPSGTRSSSIRRSPSGSRCATWMRPRAASCSCPNPTRARYSIMSKQAAIVSPLHWSASRQST